ncbi:PLC-like phosphodiesterase [Tothia fuscella]|uniref:PLC-like phosphodiesterase n=1 Tax=Tothia fuscella TaxID=1048955 RepID=A0A9P4P2K2_9PEZI|nr:PLC-like phosphodiesterase [Tothia fuscella]
MPSKGLQIYTFIGIPNCEVEYTVPGRTLIRKDVDHWFNDHLEVDKKNIKDHFNFTERFTLQVRSNNNKITSQWCDINTLTGNVEQSTMKAMRDQRSIIKSDLIVTYGFYDADQGQAGLPNSDQVWVTVTPNRANWMGELAPAGSIQARQRFSKLVLPAAHDIGMNSMQNCDAILSRAGKTMMNLLKGTNDVVFSFASKLSKDVLVAMAPNIISGLAITQKDTLDDILAIGARYFEFRPAHLHKALLEAGTPLPDKLYFHHGPIPGMSYEEFLYGCVEFLKAHQSEIIVVQIRWDGVPAECSRPSDPELVGYLSSALISAKGSILAGSVDDMKNLTIDDLRTQRKRLIVFKATDSYSTYTDAANATLNGDTIIAEFEKLKASSPRNRAFTNLQCQATAANIPEVVIYSVVSANTSNSCLLSTKACCDSKTLPWIRRNALRRLTEEGLIVVMNDFFDGATADVAIGMSRQRLG